MSVGGATTATVGWWVSVLPQSGGGRRASERIVTVGRQRASERIALVGRVWASGRIATVERWPAGGRIATVWSWRMVDVWFD